MAESLEARANREAATVHRLAAERAPIRPGPTPFVRIAELVRDTRAVPWLVKRRMERGTTVCVFGEPEHGKSLHMLDVGLHIAAGIDWNGHRVTQGAVFHLGPEGREGLKRRALAWSIRHEIPLDGLPLFAHTLSVDLSDPTAALAIGEAVAALARENDTDPQLIVVDTLSRHLAGDENSSADMARFIANVDALVREPTGACVVLVHHVGHGDKTRARGSTVLRGAVDTEYRVSRDPETGVVEVACSKAKDWPRPAPMHFALRVVELGIKDEDGEDVTGVVLDPTDAPTPAGANGRPMGANQRKALATLKRLEDEHRQRVEDSGRDGSAARVALDTWREATGLDRYRWREVLEALNDRGLIQQEAGYVRTAE